MDDNGQERKKERKIERKKERQKERQIHRYMDRKKENLQKLYFSANMSYFSCLDGRQYEK